MTRAVEDKATVKIYYENRIIKLEADEDILEELDEEFEEITEGQEEEEREKNKAKWSRIEAIVGSPNRIKKLAEDIVNHYETKAEVMDGKAMVVCMSRRIFTGLVCKKPEQILLLFLFHKLFTELKAIRTVIFPETADYVIHPLKSQQKL